MTKSNITLIAETEAAQKAVLLDSVRRLDPETRREVIGWMIGKRYLREAEWILDDGLLGESANKINEVTGRDWVDKILVGILDSEANGQNSNRPHGLPKDAKASSILDGLRFVRTHIHRLDADRSKGLSDSGMKVERNNSAALLAKTVLTHSSDFKESVGILAELGHPMDGKFEGAWSPLTAFVWSAVSSGLDEKALLGGVQRLIQAGCSLHNETNALVRFVIAGNWGSGKANAEAILRGLEEFGLNLNSLSDAQFWNQLVDGNRDPKMMRWLIERAGSNRDLDIVDNRGRCLLGAVAEIGGNAQAKSVAMIPSDWVRSSVHRVDRAGRNALHQAAAGCRSFELRRTLIKKCLSLGVDPGLRDQKGHTAIELLRIDQAGFLDCAELLGGPGLAGFEAVNGVKELLKEATRLARPDILCQGLLLPSAKEVDLNTLLAELFASGSFFNNDGALGGATLRFLLEAGADPNGDCGKYGSPLMGALSCSWPGTAAEILLEAGADARRHELIVYKARPTSVSADGTVVYKTRIIRGSVDAQLRDLEGERVRAVMALGKAGAWFPNSISAQCTLPFHKWMRDGGGCAVRAAVEKVILERAAELAGGNGSVNGPRRM